MTDDQVKEKLNALLESCLKEDWMDKKDIEVFKTKLLASQNLSIDSLIAQIRIGEANGYSVDSQLAQFERLLTLYNAAHS